MIRMILCLLLLASPCWGLEQSTINKVDSLYPWNVSQAGIWTTSGCLTGEEWDCVNEFGADPDSNTSYLAITNSAGTDALRFQSNLWMPFGLAEIDSVYVHAQACKTGGTAGAIQFHLYVNSFPYNFDASGTLPTTTYTHYEGDQVQNPDTESDWTLADINAMSFGVDRSTNPSASQSILLSQVFLEIFWKQNKQNDTIDSQSELLDCFMASDAHTNKNYGASVGLPVGRATSSWTGRPLFFLDSTFYTTWALYYIDSAFLDVKTSAMFGGTHLIEAHTVTWGGIAGTNDGTAQNGSSCWNYSRYHAQADAWRDWDKDGDDSCGDEGGRDRNCDFMDTVTMSADETVYSVEVTEWLNMSAGFDWIHHYGYLGAEDIGWGFGTLPILLRLRQSSESLPDTQIQFYSMDAASSTDRPRLRVYGTHR